MDGFEWAQNNLGVSTPHELQGQGTNVYFAPNIRSGIKLVNLGNGQVEQFWPQEPRPQQGYYVSVEDLERFCRQRGLPLTETSGIVSTVPTGRFEAGDPIRHGSA